MKFTYLVVDFAALLVPFIFSFHPKINFHIEFRYFFPAAFIVLLAFLVWDIVFTQRGVWGFNPDYVTGIYLFRLPLEEILFFICIPFSCVFTYYCFKLFFAEMNPVKDSRIISGSLAGVLLLVAFLNTDKLYTTYTFFSLAAFIILLQFVMKVNWLGQFYFSYLVLLVPFFMVNGILTGSGLSEPVVWYDNNENLGIRIFTIPVEDIFYGMLLIMGNVAGFELFKRARHIYPISIPVK